MKEKRLPAIGLVGTVVAAVCSETTVLVLLFGEISSPVITADWEADSKDTWTVPFGGGAGRVFKIGNQAINAQPKFRVGKLEPYGPASRPHVPSIATSRKLLCQQGTAAAS